MEKPREDTADLLRAAAAGREEYAVNAPEDSADALRSQAATLRLAADVADGDLSALWYWLPSWRWDQIPEDFKVKRPES